MATKIGRNDPCPCGSGMKYKRCCLANDEAAAREDARQETLFADTEDFDDTDIEDIDIDDDADEVDDIDAAMPFDVDAVTRVCYTRGLVQKVSDLRAGRGVRVTEWEAPNIPQTVLDVLEREDILAFEGQWGDPKAADTIQVDIIDIETADDVISIEMLNRALFLSQPHTQSKEVLDMVCDVLEAAASAGEGTSAPDAPRALTPIPGDVSDINPPEIARLRRDSDAQVEPPVETHVDLSTLLKEHRRQPGVCALCGETVSKSQGAKHVNTCASAHDAPSGSQQQLVQVRVTAPGLPAYWLDLEARSDAKLEALDAFLRDVWLECCGHLSAFRIGSVSYFSRGYELNAWPDFAGLGRQRPVERKMGVRINSALPHTGERFAYEYDFGSTTSLQLEVKGERVGHLGRSPIRLVVRNVPPVWPCAICGEPATLVCTFCLGSDDNSFVCSRHKRQHACGEVGGLMPVVNSPRMGVCGYTRDS